MDMFILDMLIKYAICGVIVALMVLPVLWLFRRPISRRRGFPVIEGRDSV